ncbi:MAG: hypothetical protein AB7J28_06735 [Hyphomonadaceae bacterium]
MDLETIITLAVMAAAGVLFAYAQWKAELPPNPNKPRLLPWRTIIVLSAVLFVLALVHLVNLMGVETGGRFR